MAEEPDTTKPGDVDESKLELPSLSFRRRKKKGKVVEEPPAETVAETPIETETPPPPVEDRAPEPEPEHVEDEVSTGSTTETVDDEVSTGSTTETVEDEVSTGSTTETVDDQVSTGSTTETVDDQVPTGSTTETVDDQVPTGSTTETVDDQVPTGSTTETVDDQVPTGSTTETVDDEVATGSTTETVDDEVPTGSTTETVDDEHTQVLPSAPEAERAPEPRAEKPAKAPRQPKVRKERKPLKLPPLSAPIACAVTGVVVGLGMVALVFIASQGCSVVRDTSSCGGVGLLFLIVIVVLAVLFGAVLLKAWQIADPMNSSFLAVGLVAVIAMLFFLSYIDQWWMVIVIPAISAGTYVLAWWVTRTFIEDAVEDDAAEETENAGSRGL